jgi:hypothetical protein
MPKQDASCRTCTHFRSTSPDAGICTQQRGIESPTGAFDYCNAYKRSRRPASAPSAFAQAITLHSASIPHSTPAAAPEPATNLTLPPAPEPAPSVPELHASPDCVHFSRAAPSAPADATEPAEPATTAPTPRRTTAAADPSYGAERQREWRARKRNAGYVLVHAWTTPEKQQTINNLVELGETPHFRALDDRQYLPPASPTAARQRSWRDKQKTLGRVQIHHWVSPATAAKINKILKQ